MKKFLIQTGFSAVLFVVFGIAANGQISRQYRAEIPFDFSADGVAYSAGEYSVGPLGATSNISSLALFDRKNNRKRLIGQTALHGGAWAADAKLTFEKVNGGYTLTQIVTPTFETRLKRTGGQGKIAKKPAIKTETVAVDLH